jgi:hypothetical protein
MSLFALLGGLLTLADRGRYLPVFLGLTFVIILVVLHGQNISVASIQVLLSNSLQSRQDVRNALYLKNWLVVEVERMHSALHFWSDFRFVLKKIGFCRAELMLGEEVRNFHVPHTPHEDVDLLWKQTYATNVDFNVSLVLYGEKDNFSESRFRLVADIAAEALTNTCCKWQELNGSPMDFDSIAKEVADIQRQKARNVYRPTY